MPPEPRKRLVVAVTGASGALYAVRLLKAGLEAGHGQRGEGGLGTGEEC